MANTRIQIKRSTTTAAPTAGSLYAGELAFSNASQTLWIGNPDGSNTVTAIGTKLNYGTLTANAVLVTNSTSGIDKIQVANLVALQGIWANGASGSAGDVLMSGGSGANAYWVSQGSLTVNVNSTYSWTNVHTFTTNSIYFNANIVQNTGFSHTISTINTTSNGTLLQNNLITTGNSSVNSQIAPASITTGTFNGSVVNVATNKILANSTQLTIAAGVGLSANGGLGTAGQVLTSNATSVYWETNSNGTVTSVASGNGISGGTITGSGTLYATAGVGVVVNSSGINVNANNGIVANSTGTWAKAANGISVDSSGINVSAGNSQVVSNTTGVWINQAQIDHNSLSNFVANKHIDHSTVSIATANGVAGGGDITTTRNLYVVAANGIVANSTGVFAKQANGISVDSSGINVVGSNGIVSNSSGVYLNNSANFTVNATGVWVNTAGAFTMQDLTLNGNLTVSGTLTTIDTTTLKVKDNLIETADQLASTTSFLDNVDTGWYVKTGNTLNNFYSGVVRVAASSTNTNPYFKLFSTATAPNNTTIDTSATTGTLQSFLAPWGAGGALVVNGTNISVTANGTVAVGITANTLSLSTALPATSGGTGWGSYTAGDMLYASNTSYLSKLGIGSDGNILQIQSTTIAWSGLDGGTF